MKKIIKTILIALAFVSVLLVSSRETKAWVYDGTHQFEDLSILGITLEFYTNGIEHFVILYNEITDYDLDGVPIKRLNLSQFGPAAADIVDTIRDGMENALPPFMQPYFYYLNDSLLSMMPFDEWSNMPYTEWNSVFPYEDLALNGFDEGELFPEEMPSFDNLIVFSYINYDYDGVFSPTTPGIDGNKFALAHYLYGFPQPIYNITYENLYGIENYNPTVWTEDVTYDLTDPNYRPGYTFLGWFDQAEGGEQVFYLPDAYQQSDDLTLYARWEFQTFTITYNNLYGTDVSANPTSYDGSQSVIYMPAPVGERPGYEFTSWNVLPFQGSSFNVFDEIIIAGGRFPHGPTQNQTLRNLSITPNWTRLEYDINYTNLEGTTHSNRLTYEITTNTFNLSIPSNKEGYAFKGWYHVENEEYITSVEQGSYGNMTLEAHWIEPEFSITYENLNEADNENPEFYHSESEDFRLKNAYREGYTFLGWFDQAEDGNQIILIEKGSIGNLTLYARWEAMQAYTVTYGNLYGTDVSANPTVYYPNSPVKLLEAPVGERPGYIFTGWRAGLGWGFPFTEIRVTPSGTAIYSGASSDTYSIRNLTLNAQWQAISYDVEYTNLHGTTHSNRLTYEITTFTFNLSAPSNREGYAFMGWYHVEAEEYITSVATGSYGNMTLEARWIETDYTIHYLNIEGATHSNTGSYNYDFEDIHLSAATKSGYTFLGWYDQPTGGNQIEVIPNNSIGDKYLFARWEIENYSINYLNLKNATVYTAATYNLETSVELVPPSSINHYIFVGWFTQLTGGSEITAVSGTGNRSVYARWEAIEYTIDYDLQGGYFNNENPNRLSYNIETPTFSINSNSLFFRKEGYFFLGWFDQAEDGNQITSIEEGSYGNITLYARWELEVRTARFYFVESHSNLNFDNPLEITFTYTILDLPVKLPDPSEYMSINGYKANYWYSFSGPTIPVKQIESMSLSGEYYLTISKVNYTITYKNFITSHNNASSYDIESSTIQLTDPSSRPGHTFLGWFDAVEGGNKFTSIGEGSYGNLTLYARWDDDVVITLNAYGGVNMEPVIAQHNEKLELLDEPIRPGYSFIAWYKDAELTELYDFNDLVTTSFTLYAKWELKYYQVDLDIYFEREDLINPGVVHEIDNTVYSIYNILYNDEINVFLDYQGYVFDRYIVNGEVFYDANKLVRVIGNMQGEDSILVYYRRIILNVTFNQDPELFNEGEEFSHTFKVYYNDQFELENIPVLREKEYHFAFWSQTISADYRVIQNLNINALYYLEGFRTINFNDGSILRNIVFQFDPEDHIAITSSSDLWNITKNGNTFLGWFTHPTQGVLITQQDLSFFNPNLIYNGNIAELYARWSIASYTISYNNLHGTTHNNPSNYTIESPTITLNNPSNRAGYVFLGWSTTPDGAEIATINSGSYGNMTLYAKWNKIHTVTFDSNGGTFVASQFVENQNQIMQPSVSRSGYMFMRWNYINELGQHIEWNFDRNLESDITLIAEWLQRNLVTFNTYGGSEVPDQYVSSGSYLFKPEDPTRPGHTFQYWAYIYDGGWEPEFIEWDFNNYQVNDNEILHAIWEKTDLIVNIDLAGGTFKPDTLFTEEFEWPRIESFDLTDLYLAVEKLGYTVSGFRVGAVVYSKYDTISITNDITIMVEWEALVKVTIGLEGGHDTNPDEPIQLEEYYDSHESIDLAIISNQIAKSGHVLSGYLLLPGQFFLSTDYVLEIQSLSQLNNWYISALWDEINAVITVDLNGGNFKSGTLFTEEFEWPIHSVTGEVFDLTDLYLAVEKENHELVGWIMLPEEIQLHKWATLNVEVDFTLVAVWQAKYVVTFNSNGGSAVDNQSVLESGYAVKPEDPTRPDHTFQYWAYIYDGGWEPEFVEWDFNNYQVNDNVILHAIWEKTDLIVNIDLAGGNFKASTSFTEEFEWPRIESFDLTDLYLAVEKLGYTVSGFRVGDVFYSKYDTISITNDITIIVEWEAKYVVTFNSNGGTAVDNQYVDYGEFVVIPDPPTKEGYIFKQWNPSIMDAITEDTTFTAEWTKLYTVYFITNWPGSVVNPIEVPEGSKIGSVTPPPRAGYNFVGWYKDAAFQNVWRFETDTIDQDTVLHAQWVPTGGTTDPVIDDGHGQSINASVYIVVGISVIATIVIILRKRR